MGVIGISQIPQNKLEVERSLHRFALLHVHPPMFPVLDINDVSSSREAPRKREMRLREAEGSTGAAKWFQ